MDWTPTSLSFPIGSDREAKPDATWKVHCGFDSAGDPRFKQEPLGSHKPGPVELPVVAIDNVTGARTYPQVPDDPSVTYDVDLWVPVPAPEGENVDTVLGRLLA